MIMSRLNSFLAPILDELELYFTSAPLSNEHEIIKHLQVNNVTPFNSFSLSNTQDLFSAHFLCMHALYHLNKQYQNDNKFKLIIKSVSIQRIELNDARSRADTLQHVVEIIDPLESYYLNPKHYVETNEDEINDLLKSFWQKYIAQDNKKEALDTLALPMDADIKMIKAQYLRLAQKHHPDKGGDAEVFAKIHYAKTVLEKC